MLLPLVLGYVVGAVGVYAILYKSAPFIVDSESETVGHEVKHGFCDTTVIELFPEQEVRRAA